MENKIEVLGEKEEELAIGMGSFWEKDGGDIYILGVAEFNKVALTNLVSGDKLISSVAVEDYDSLTAKEWQEARRNLKFTRITVPFKITPQGD